MAKSDSNVAQQPETPEKETPGIRHPEVVVILVGTPGNEYQAMVKVARALKKAKVPPAEIGTFMQEAAAGGADKLLATLMQWVSVR